MTEIITQKQATGLRKYFYEYVVIALVLAVITLFGLYYNLNNFITQSLMQTINQTNITIQRNSDIIQQTIKK